MAGLESGETVHGSVAGRSVLSTRNFAVTGVAGFVAPRHLQAIADTGHVTVAAFDPHDAVGVLDRCAFGARFFTTFDDFQRHLEWRQRGPDGGRVDVMTVCAPNDVHVAHVASGLRLGADVICEKPLVVDPRDLDTIERLEEVTGCRVCTVLQLRLHPALVALRQRLAADVRHHDVALTYVAARGPWYDASWKGDAARSGGIAMNIGIHLFDLLLWMFGGVVASRVHLAEPRRMAGTLDLARARVRWFLSTDACDLPPETVNRRSTTFRAVDVDGETIEFTDGPADLHTRVYEDVLAGRSIGLAEARPSIELVDRIRASAGRAAARGVAVVR